LTYDERVAYSTAGEPLGPRRASADRLERKMEKGQRRNAPGSGGSRSAAFRPGSNELTRRGRRRVGDAAVEMDPYGRAAADATTQGRARP